MRGIYPSLRTFVFRYLTSTKFTTLTTKIIVRIINFMNIEIHSTQLIKQALLDATQFIIKRLEDSNQESYELVGYDDALLTLMEYHGYKLSQMDGDGEFTLYQNGAIIIHHVTRYEAYKEILDRIYDVVIYDI